MKIAGTTALVTGANRGFGRALAAELLARGATVYAGARDPGSVDLPGAIPVAIVFVYYVVASISITLGELNDFMAVLMAWFPNALFTAIGLYMLRRASYGGT